MASYPVLQEKEGEWTSQSHFEILGLRLPTIFTHDPSLLSDYITKFQTRSDDVFVVTYPKSGTTWVQEIVWQIYNKGNITREKLICRVPFLELGTTHTRERPNAETLPSPRIIKSHLSYDVIPKSSEESAKCKYIYIARNPKDVSVSFFHHTEISSKLRGNGFNGPWDFFIDLFMKGKVGWSHWTDHVLGWWKHREDPNVLFLKYEDLHKDLPSNVRLIAEFVQKPLSDEIINRIAEQCTFEGMMKNADSFKVIDRGDHSFQILRKGAVGDWKNYFTSELNERFGREVLEKLRGSGLEFEYEI
ncbi:amine sulfotransferase-like [Montipora foliosa]|uniref:amine sulfotransferase-like n=1 Tax=Montipora foliosa TaxID=591990 RepID=UPI0035F10B67